MLMFFNPPQACLASGSYIVEMNVHNYQNPSGRCDGCQTGNDPGCCDEDFIRPANQGCPSTGSGAAVCDPFTTHCSVPLGNPPCDPNTEGIFSVIHIKDTNFVDFDARGDFFGIQLPLIVEGEEPWNVSVIYNTR